MRRILIGFFILFISLNCSAYAGAVTYYVDATGGNDGNTGLSDAQAWATLGKVTSTLTGDQSDTNVYLKRGSVWREMMEYEASSYGTSGHPFTIGAYGTGADPKIMGSEQITGWEHVSGNVWRASCANYPGGGDNNGPVFFINTNGDGKTHWGVEDTTPDAEYDWYWSSNYLYCWSPADPDTRYGAVEAAMRYNGITTNYLTSYLYWRDIEICYTARQGLYGNTDGHYNTVDSCHIHHNGPYSGDTVWAADNIMWEGNGWTIKNNILHDAYAHNVQHMGGSAVSTGDIIEHNICYNGAHGQVDVKHLGPTGSVINQIIRYNLIYTDSDFPWQSINTVASISVRADMGYFMDNTQIYGNIILDFWQWGIFLEAGVDGATVYNNVIYGRNPLATDTTGYPAAIGLFGWNLNPPRNVTIKNNIIAGALQPTDTGIVLWYDDDLNMLSDCDYNDFYITTGHFIKADAGNQDITYDAGDWNAWKTDTGFDTHSKWNYDPKFVNPSTQDFHLQPSSPAIDNGTGVGLTVDFDGNPIVGVPDIGAYEYQGTGNTWYVRPAGGSYGSEDGGSYANAWDGLKNVVWGTGGVEAGDTLYICGTHLYKDDTGSWGFPTNIYLVSGSAGNVITIRGDCPGDPGVVWGHIIPSHQAWQNEGNNTYSITLAINTYDGWVMQDISDTSYIKLTKRSSLQEVKDNAGSYYLTGTGIGSTLYVHTTDNGDPTDRIAVARNGWNFVYPNNCQYITMTDLKVYGHYRFVFSNGKNCSHLTWRNFTLHISPGFDGFGIYDGNHYFTWENCIIEYTRTGIYTVSNTDNAPSHCIVRNCTVRECGTSDHVAPTGDYHGIAFQGGHDNLVEYNEVYNCAEGIGFYLDEPMNFYNNTARYNYVHDLTPGKPTGGYGIWFSKDALIDFSGKTLTGNKVYGNILVGTGDSGGRGIAWGYPNILDCYNNVIYNFDFPFRIGISDNYVPGMGVNFKNNIVHTAGSYYMWADFPAYDSGEYSVVSDNNIFYPGTGNMFYLKDNAGTTTTDFSGWQSFSKPGCTFDPNSLTLNPLFVNLGNRDFHLQSSSPAIDNGTFVGLTMDFEGNPLPQGAGFDIGAFEYLSGFTLPGDLNGDGVVDIADLAIIAIHFGKRNTHPQWNATADTVSDFEIDVFDVVFVASRFT